MTSRTRKVNGQVWAYCDCEGFWWLQQDGKDTRVSVRRSNNNQNIWILCDGEDVQGQYDTMKEAMQAAMVSKLTAPERIMEWCKREWNPKYVENVYQDLIDVATGTREGNVFEKQALARIFPGETIWG